MANGTVRVAADTFTDVRGNGNVAGTFTPAITIDTVAPTITAFSAAAGTYGIGDRIEITATFSEPVRGGGRVVVGPVTRFVVQYRVAGGRWVTANSRVPGSATALEIGRLTSSRSYEFRVAAVNAAGQGSFGTSAIVGLRTLASR